MHLFRFLLAFFLLFRVGTVSGKPADGGVLSENDYRNLFNEDNNTDNDNYNYKPPNNRKTIGGSCILDVNKDLPKKNEPLLLARGKTGSLALVLPEAEGRRGVIALREGEEVYIACPGNRNHLEGTKQEFSRAVCRAGTTLNIDGRDWQSENLDCSSRSAASTKVTQRRCANGKGVIVELGFEAGGWTKLIETCHNLERSQTYYSVHIVNGGRVAGKVYRRTGRPNFARGDRVLFRGFNPETAYTQRNQQTVLSHLLGTAQATELLGQTFLARGHLSPDADFLLSPHQLLTYFYVNVAPQWQSINAGNWLRIEEATRRTAGKLGADFEVVTGTFGTLALPGEKGEKEVHLHQDRIPVPEFFWKVLRNTQDDSCIAFVASNDPFSTNPPRHICPNVCSRNNWPEYTQDYSKGYIYCCEYAQIKKAIPEIPNLDCKSALRG